MKKILRRGAVLVGGLIFPMLLFAGPVNVNSADAETLSAELQGVGLSKAQAIVADRKANGPFRTADDLARVKGIGSRTIDLNRRYILVQDPN